MSLDFNNAHFNKEPPKQQMRDGVKLTLVGEGILGILWFTLKLTVVPWLGVIVIPGGPRDELLNRILGTFLPFHRTPLQEVR